MMRSVPQVRPHNAIEIVIIILDFFSLVLSTLYCYALITSRASIMTYLFSLSVACISTLNFSTAYCYVLPGSFTFHSMYSRPDVLWIFKWRFVSHLPLTYLFVAEEQLCEIPSFVIVVVHLTALFQLQKLYKIEWDVMMISNNDLSEVKKEFWYRMYFEVLYSDSRVIRRN